MEVSAAPVARVAARPELELDAESVVEVDEVVGYL